MKTKTYSRSDFLESRFSRTLLLRAAASSSLAGTLLAFLRPEVPSKVSKRTLTFADRVAYQHAIEEVYWRHRIWPEELPDAKPSLNEIKVIVTKIRSIVVRHFFSKKGEPSL